MKIKGIDGINYVLVSGIERAFVESIDIIDSLTATKRNYDSIEDWSMCDTWSTKVFIDNPALLGLFAHSIVLANDTRMCFIPESAEMEMKINLITDGDVADWKVNLTISLPLKESVDTNSNEYIEHMRLYEDEYSKLAREYGFETIEEVEKYEMENYNMMIGNWDNINVIMDIDFTDEETKAVKDYFMSYFGKCPDQYKIA